MAVELNQLPWEVGELSIQEFVELEVFFEMRMEAQKKEAQKQRKAQPTTKRRKR